MFIYLLKIILKNAVHFSVSCNIKNGITTLITCNLIRAFCFEYLAWCTDSIDLYDN